MANVTHASLTGAELHEPKGVESANLGDVYVANGSGSGSWSSIASATFTGMVADFVAPIAPTGWLECDGSVINSTTYDALYAVMTVQQTGTRISGNAVITSLTSTTNLRPGYYVFGTGIAGGTTIVSVDSATQVTLSGNASSSGTATVIFSPWLLGNGTIQLPNLTSGGRFRRSRTATTHIGTYQSDDNKPHTHTGSTSTNGLHQHTVSGLTSSENITHDHAYANALGASGSAVAGADFTAARFVANNTVTNSTSVPHAHSFNVTSGAQGDHSHTFTTASSGTIESRPYNATFITCVKI